MYVHTVGPAIKACQVVNGFAHGLTKYVYTQLWETCCADINNNSLTAQGYNSLTSN